METGVSVSSNAIRYLADRRYAFLMAFHPRLGHRASIRKITKDVGKLIAKKYLSFASQIVVRNHPTRGNMVKLKSGDDVAIQLQTTDKKHNSHADDRLSLFPTFALDRGLCQWGTIQIQTPSLKVLFGLDNGRGEIRNILTTSFDNRGERFFTWFRSIEQCIEEEFAKVSAQDKIWRSQTYNSAIRQRLPHAPYLTTRIVKQSSFWNQERKKYVGLNDAKSSFKHGAIVKLIIANRGVWADRRYATSQWVLVQVLLVHPAFDPSNEFMITDTPENRGLQLCRWISADENEVEPIINIWQYVESQTKLITGATVVVSAVSINAENQNDLIVTVRFCGSKKDLFGCFPGKFGVNAFKNDRWVMWHKFETLTEAVTCSEILKRQPEFIVYVWDLTKHPNKIVVV